VIPCSTRNERIESTAPAKPDGAEAVRILREHLDDDDAEMLADRYLTTDRMQRHQPEIAVMKRRLIGARARTLKPVILSDHADATS
jgi:hypothetical protein